MTTHDLSPEQVMITERMARDTAQWERMGAMYHADSVVDVSWIRTDGPRFVEISRAGFEADSRSTHALGAVLVETNGDRALADAGVVIAGPVSLEGRPMFLTAHGRMVERLERRDGVWRISELRCLYQFDHLASAGDAGAPLDADRLARYRTSYSALSYWTESTHGADAVRDDLPGIDRPESIARLYDDNRRWLAGA